MKILITGFNKNQCTRQFYLRQQLQVVPSHYSLMNCLLAMGHEVEQRIVEIGEDISHYDEVIIFVAGPRQLVTGYLFNGLWALSQRPDAILAYDDWQAADLLAGVEKCQSDDELYCDFILRTTGKTKEELTPYHAQFKAAIDKIVAKDSRLLVSAFNSDHLNDDSYGAHTLFEEVNYPKELIFQYNPNPYHRNRKNGDFGNYGAEDPTQLITVYDEEIEFKKERRFNFASLVQSRTKKWLRSQGINPKELESQGATLGGWPIDVYGSRKEPSIRLKEPEMCKVYHRDWACLMPGYSHSKSLWWRARPLQLADAGSILIGEPDELAGLYGKDFKYLNLKAKDIVDMSDEQLKEIAFAQREAIYRIHPLDQKVQQREIQAILDAK